MIKFNEYKQTNKQTTQNIFNTFYYSTFQVTVKLKKLG